MAQIDRNRPLISATYAQQMLRLGEALGQDAGEVQSRLDFRVPEGRIRGLIMKVSIAQQEQLARTILQIARERGVDPGGYGYEMGLSVTPASHGVLGLAILSQLTVRQAIQLFIRFRNLVLPGVRFHIASSNGMATITVEEETQRSEDLRQQFYAMALSGLWRSVSSLIPDPKFKAEAELWFAHPEPPHHAKYQDRLPSCRFDMNNYQLRAPEYYLNQKMVTGDAHAAKALEDECQTELELIDSTRDVVSQVQDLLNSRNGGYPDITDVSKQLHMSRSTLRRKLQRTGKNYQQMREEAMAHEAMQFLRDPAIPIEKIATRLGYADPANFTRAFRRWTGMTPSQWRGQRLSE